MKASLASAAEAYARSLKRLGQKSVRLSAESVAALRTLEAEKAPVSHASPPAFSPSTERSEPVSFTRSTGKTTPAPVPAQELPFHPTGDKEADMEHLGAIASGCVKCPYLAANRTHVVFGVGNIDADLMFVGEAPGADEDVQGEPFVGRAGQLLTKMIEATGLKRRDVYIANVLKCRPDMPKGVPGNRKPTQSEMRTCLPYLKWQIRLIKPKVMVGLGGTAYEGLFGLEKVTMGAVRGIWKEFEGIPFMPTFHPSYLLRNPSNQQKRVVWEDLLQVMEKLKMPISEKQRGFFLDKK